MKELSPVLLELFVQSNSSVLAEIEEDVRHRRFGHASQKAHAIRGSALLARAHDVSQATSSLMEMLAAEDADAALSFANELREKVLSFVR